MKDNKKIKHKKRNFIKMFFVVAIITILTIIIFFVGINIYVVLSVKGRIITLEEAQNLNADCVLVLGAGVKDDGSPSDMLSDRLTEGIAVYKSGASQKMLMSGDHGREDYDEVNTMKNFAIDKGVPSEAIFMDHAGFSTYDSMYRAYNIFKVKKAVVITQKYHLYRALYVAKRMGIDAYGVSADLREYRGQTYFSLRESVARVKDFFSVIFKPQPQYLGDVIAIDGNGNITNDK